MVFSSTVFLFVFLPAVLILYYCPFIFKSDVSIRNFVLFIASLFFYAWGEPVFVCVILFSVFVTWATGRLIDKKKRKWILIIGVSYHLTVLFIFKYLSFFARELSLLLHEDSISTDIVLPIGISFFTFQMISYLADVYNKTAEAQSNPLYVGLYSVFFPQMIAGPIVRYNQIAASITNRKESWSGFSAGMMRFVYGLAKKVLIANYVAQIVDSLFDQIAGRSVTLAWLGALCYALQIYYDFSGYSDMAIGLGRMFGFKFEENFRYPYTSSNVTEFWHRWHISLGTWFRDYVYIPLGGNRVSHRRHILNLFIVWALTGLWHGANWTFLVWGMYYFVLLVIENKTGISKSRSVISWIYTVVAVTIGWVIFRSPDLDAAVSYLGNMAGIGATAFIDTAVKECLTSTWPILIIACVGTFPIIKAVKRLLDKIHLSWMEYVWIVIIFTCSILQVVSSTYNPFIYFNF